jgi:hypothetical protein
VATGLGEMIFGTFRLLPKRTPPPARSVTLGPRSDRAWARRSGRPRPVTNGCPLSKLQTCRPRCKWVLHVPCREAQCRASGASHGRIGRVSVSVYASVVLTGKADGGSAYLRDAPLLFGFLSGAGTFRGLWGHGGFLGVAGSKGCSFRIQAPPTFCVRLYPAESWQPLNAPSPATRRAEAESAPRSRLEGPHRSNVPGVPLYVAAFRGPRLCSRMQCRLAPPSGQALRLGKEPRNAVGAPRKVVALFRHRWVRDV